MYCVTNNNKTIEVGLCFRRSQGGLIQIYMPKGIGDYNYNMGVVDIVDMRRLHCNSNIMGLHWWWFKFFIYLPLELLMTWYFTTS